MELLHAALHLLQGEDPRSTFPRLATTLAEHLPLRCAVRIRISDGEVLSAWPEAPELSEELLAGAAHAPNPEVFPLGSQFPRDAVRHPGSEMLLLPLRSGDEPSTALLIAAAGTFGEDLEPWRMIAAILEHQEALCDRAARAEAECGELRRRAEEIEALQTLGLAANRTLDPDEVLQLVARFTRTLLGSHYVTVSTVEQGSVHTAASIGIRTEGVNGDYHLARTVVEAGKALVVGGPDGELDVSDFPFHAAEGMRTGLGIPLSLFGETFGALVVGYRSDFEPTARDVRLALTLAGHAAVAINNARLHRTLADRSLALAGAYERLSSVTRERERFYNAISHDLRTPIGAVKGYCDLLADGVAGALSSQALRYVGNAQRAAMGMLELVDDLMDFAKLEAGKLEVDPLPVAPGRLVEDAVATVEPQASAKGLRLIVPPLADLPEIVTDGRLVCRILSNLLSNAVKFTDAGEVAVELAWLGDRGEDAEPREAARLEFRVRDTGRGIPAADLERVFGEFEQVRGSSGTGLGLPVSRRLARLLGGELTAVSSGAGSVFTLGLPVSSEARGLAHLEEVGPAVVARAAG
jgi:signal transduction histidine kinase